MKNFDPKEILEKKYNGKLCYNHLLSPAITMGEYDLVQRFLQNVPNTVIKGLTGTEIINYYCLKFLVNMMMNKGTV